MLRVFAPATPTGEINTAESHFKHERWFLDLIAQRQIEDRISPALIENSVLLCSEATPHQCHRRLVAEYLAERWESVTIEHL